MDKRVIKFRGWDPVIKSMHFSEGRFRQVIYGGASDDVAIGMDLHYSIKNWDRWGDGKTQRSISEIIFMQFTGVLDKNGKEIYEGDIVHSKQWNPESQRVVFNRGGFCLCNDDSSYYPDIKYAEQMEVIGNVYENPELANPPVENGGKG